MLGQRLLRTKSIGTLSIHTVTAKTWCFHSTSKRRCSLLSSATMAIPILMISMSRTMFPTIGLPNPSSDPSDGQPVDGGDDFVVANFGGSVEAARRASAVGGGAGCRAAMAA